jgi:hypothetical protein
MRPFILTLVPAIAVTASLLGAGCSQEAVKRSSFETLQNLREQQCGHDLSGHCPPRESYEHYQRKRDEALDRGDGKEPAAPP